MLIDEIDRLSGQHILNFLTFARVLEEIDGLTTLVAIDYGRAKEKLSKEIFHDYDLVDGYLEKFFQVIIHMDYSNQQEKLKGFAYASLKKSLGDESFEKLTWELTKANSHNVFDDCLYILETPRDIKRWLLNLVMHKRTVLNSNKPNLWLSFIALITKHPSILSHATNITQRYYLNGYDTSAEEFLSNKYKIQKQAFDLRESRGKENIRDEILLLTAGILKTNGDSYFKDKVIDALYKESNNMDFVVDDFKADMFLHFWKKIDNLELSRFLNNSVEDESTNLVTEFFEGDSNNVLAKIIEQPDSKDIRHLVKDLVTYLSTSSMVIEKAIKVDLLNDYWRKKIGSFERLPFNPFAALMRYVLPRFQYNEILEKSHLSLSEYYINIVLNEKGIRNNNGSYDIGTVNNILNSNNPSFMFFEYNGHRIESINTDDIKKMMLEWACKAPISSPVQK